MPTDSTLTELPSLNEDREKSIGILRSSTSVADMMFCAAPVSAKTDSLDPFTKLLSPRPTLDIFFKNLHDTELLCIFQLTAMKSSRPKHRTPCRYDCNLHLFICGCDRPSHERTANGDICIDRRVSLALIVNTALSLTHVS